VLTPLLELLDAADMNSLASQWMMQIADYLQVGYAFGAGMVSAVNPCGFSMLPVYLSLYLGNQENTFQHHSLLFRLAKAGWIAAIVTGGFALLFGVFGIIVSAGGAVLVRFMPWISVVVGAFLVLLGIWLLAGKYLSFNWILRLANKIGDPRKMTIRGFFLFGVAYGATSLSCTLPIFLMVVGSSATAGSFLSGIIRFVGYILGMGTVLLFLTLSMAFIKEGVVVGLLRKALPYIQKVSAVLIMLSGGYVLYYWFSSGLLFS
jgi:cytochrome c-type biogenesis protein